MTHKLNLPTFANEDKEREYWANVDLGDYLEAEDFESVAFPNLNPTTRPVSIRFPEYVIDAVKEKANEMGIPSQALIKETIARAFVPQDPV